MPDSPTELPATPGSPSSGPIVINGLTCLQIGYRLDGGTITIETDAGNFYCPKQDKQWRYQESHIVIGNPNTVSDLERMIQEDRASGYLRGSGRFKANETSGATEPKR